MRIAHAATIALGATMLVALPVKADLVFKMSNQSNVEAKGVAQNVQVLWLKKGQTTDIRVKGNWTVKSCFAGMCPAQIASSYTVNFENLSTSSQQYCVWQITVDAPYGGEGTAWGFVNLHAKLTQSDPNFVCEQGGQMSAPYHNSSQGQGATMNFTLKNKGK